VIFVAKFGGYAALRCLAVRAPFRKRESHDGVALCSPVLLTAPPAQAQGIAGKNATVNSVRSAKIAQGSAIVLLSYPDSCGCR
jgi:hypothetical protein